MTTSASASIQTSYQELQKVQKEIGKLFNNKQILTAQLRENELVKTEVDLLDESSTIYKLVGPVMVTQDYAEVKNTVASRIDYLKTELEKVDRKLESLESKAEEHRKVLMELQNKT
ncbi:hypothetical protein GAYE_SCF39G5306 [Galdieria yellowstonensis]|uniref:Prefoldin subunit 6 n=1 Tax=Galdieria yellowstonensis TaxID=3028027 RepID=A0AAV9IJ84_9RHOD|nr:hypothetical protein GAYE_SCF39G5306 [Galdieria yellowstonensis]